MRSRRIVAVAAPLLTIGCSHRSAVATPAPDAAISYVTRLGADTVTVEQYRRAGNHIDAEIMQRSPLTYVARSSVDLNAAGLATSWNFDPRLLSGSRPPNAPTRALTMGADSTTVVSDTGAQFRRRVAGGQAIPTVNNSMLTWQLAIDYARAQGRDSVAVPVTGVAGGHSTLPIRFLAKDSILSYGGGPMYPIYIKLGADGKILRYDGSATTNKVIATRVTDLDVRTVASAYTVRDQMTGAMGTSSPRDTVRAQIQGQQLWIDYSRPSLRGRNVWTNGVLGDTLWRTGANAATQFSTDTELTFGNHVVPAGKYTLWTHVFPGNSRYELIVNRQTGQWGAGANTYDAKNDLARVPLTVKQMPNSAERFTISIEPSGDGAILAMQWGATRLETPFSVRKP